MVVEALLRRLAAESDGYTLIELMVSMAIGLVIALAAFGLIEVTTRATGRVTDQVGANQIGRQSAAYVESELQASCIQAGGQQSDGSYWGPIQTNVTSPSSSSTKLVSDGSDIVFWTVSDATATAGVTYASTGTSYALHYIQFTGGTLVDTSWPVTSGTSPSTFVYGTATTRTLGKINGTGVVSQVGTTPVFQYYGYDATYNLSTTPLTLPLTTTTAPGIASVAVSYQVEGNKGDNTSKQNSSQAAPYIVNDSVSLRLTAVQSPSASNVPYPCQ
jgi:prepilin-type N-terminal cleavage/methylation domain-containing protein